MTDDTFRTGRLCISPAGDRASCNKYYYYYYYAPTGDRDDSTKDTFYDQVQAETQAALCNDLRIVVGDLKVKVGGNSTYYERAIKEER